MTILASKGKSTHLIAHRSPAGASPRALRRRQTGVNKEKNSQLENGSNQLELKIRSNRILTTRSKGNIEDILKQTLL